MVVLLFSARLWDRNPDKALPLQKNLLATPLSVLFLLCQSRYVLFLLGTAMFLIFVVQER
jgi:hypothetical protein